jgi:anti-sigma B factor antagonist
MSAAVERAAGPVVRRKGGEAEVVLTVEVDGDLGIIRVGGEIDLQHAPRLSEAAEELLGNGARDLLFDVGQVEFIDSSGLNALVRAYQRARAQGGTITIRHPNDFTRRLLEVTGLEAVLTVETDADAD